MVFSEFTRMIHVSKQDICREIYARKGENSKIKKEKTFVKNLARIFDAALKISNEKGFAAMSMRDLSRTAGLSMGALYAYFSGKDELLEMLQQTGRTITIRLMTEQAAGEIDPRAKLRTAVLTHLFLSEAMQPWFYFFYMEAKNMNEEGREKAKAAELATEQILADIIREGQDLGLFNDRNPLMTAAVIKAMLQDWYLKRWKYAARHVTVDQYGRFLIDFIEAFCLKPDQKSPRLEQGVESGPD